MSDYYQLLEVDRDAGPEEIKRAYRRLARQYHPDVNGNDPASAKRFKEINKAYASCPTRTSASATTPTEAGVEGLAGQGGSRLRRLLRRPGPVLRRRRPVRRARPDPLGTPRRDHRHAAAPAVHRGGLRHLQGRPRPGRGHLLALQRVGARPGTEPTVCSRCNGSGQQRTVRQSLLGQLVTATTCPVCSGTGQEIRSPCPVPGPGAADGGLHPHHRHPPGLEDGSQIRYQGRGHAGQFGGPPAT